MLLATSAGHCWAVGIGVHQGPTAGAPALLPPVSPGEGMWLKGLSRSPDGGTDAGLERHAEVDVVEVAE